MNERCRKCGRAFDPFDTNPDGQGRQLGTDWCRSCVTRCHTARAERQQGHACPVCDPDNY